MAVYTRLTIDEVNEIMSRYGIEGITHYQELSGGSQNSNYVIRSGSGDFVLSICEQSSKQEVLHLALLLEHLTHHQFSTSILIRTSGGDALSTWNDKPVMVKQFINGIVSDNIPKHICTLIGKELGKLHQVPAPDYIPLAMSYGKEYFYEIELYASGSEYHHWLLDKQEYIDSHITETLPKTLIHSDVFSSNVIIDKSEKFVTIMDFEEATHYYRIFDIAMTLIGICREGSGINFQKSSAIIDGYSQEIRISEEELKSLQSFVVYAATAMSFWRHKNFNYTVPTPSLCDHYLELKRIADTIHSIPPKDFFQQLGY